MGLRLDSVENVSSIGMDRNYPDPRRPRSRDRSRRNSYEKNHRVSGERGLNGSRPVPVEIPLNVIIAKNDNFENGHYVPKSSGYNHLLEEDFTKKTLDLIHCHSSAATPASSFMHSGPSTSSSVQNASSASPQKLTGRHEEVQKRRNVGEKVEKSRAENKLESFIPQVDQATPNQVSMNVRRFARNDSVYLPEKMRNFILEGSTDSPMVSVKPKSSVQSTRNVVMQEDGEATDYDDLDEDEKADGPTPSSSHIQWLMERASFIVKDTKNGERLDATQLEIARLTKLLADIESQDRTRMDEMIEGRTDEQGCARCIPWDGAWRRKLMNADGQPFHAVPSTSRDTSNWSLFYDYGQQYMHRASSIPSYSIRKNKNKAIWLNTRELEEEKMRNGVKKKEERDRREKRKMERAEKEEPEEDEQSDEYEMTDDDDEEMPTANHSKRSNGAPKEKKRKRDAERKTSKKENSKNRRASDLPGLGSRLSSVASRPSFDGDMDYLTPSFNHSTWLEHFKNQRGTNFTYNKIPVPECRRVEIENVETDDDMEDGEEYTTESMMKRLAAQHHILEHEERLRFTINPRGQRPSRAQRGTSRDGREESQESGERSRSTPSNRDDEMDGEGGGETSQSIPTPSVTAPTPTRARGNARPPIPPFSYESIRPVSDYERLSIEAPYEKRKWER